MGTLFGVLVVIGAAAMVLPRVLRRQAPQDRAAADKPGTGRTASPAAAPVTTTESPSRRFMTGTGQRVGSGGVVAPEPLRDATRAGGWQPEMGSGFHQTTAYPEPPAQYEKAEDQLRSGSRPAAKPPAPVDGLQSN